MLGEMVRLALSVVLTALAFSVLASACGSFDASEDTPLPNRDASGADAVTDALAPDDADAAAPRPRTIFIYGGNDYRVADGAIAFRKTAYRAVIADDGSLGEWTPVPSLDITLASTGFVTPLEGALVATGGVPEVGGAFGNPTNDVRWTTTTSTAGWVSAPSLPITLAGHAVTVVDGVIVVAGGTVAGGTQSAIVFTSRFDAAAGGVGTWATAGSLAEASTGGALATVGQRIYIAGGQRVATQPPTFSNEVWWSTVRPDGSVEAFKNAGAIPLPALRNAFGHVLLGVGGRLVFAGGTTSGNTGADDAFVGDVAADGSVTWKLTTPLPFGTRLGCAVVDRASFYVFGGRDLDAIGLSARGTLQPNGAVTWTAVRPLPETRESFGCAIR